MSVRFRYPAASVDEVDNGGRELVTPIGRDAEVEYGFAARGAFDQEAPGGSFGQKLETWDARSDQGLRGEVYESGSRVDYTDARYCALGDGKPRLGSHG